MPEHEMLQLGATISWVVFLFAVGACVGSLTNVLVYRLPLGMGVVTQGSKCPACGTPLTWRENIPVFGWLFLRGRCRFCRTPISPEYPMVEAFCGLLFAGVFLLWYAIPQHALFLDIHWGLAAPEWARADRFDQFSRTTWAPFVAVLVLLGSLTAMTLVDAKTFSIPLVIPWFATCVGVAIHTIGALVEGPLRSSAPGTGWAIPTPGGSEPQSAQGWFLIGGSLGGILGIGLSLCLIKFRSLRRSFDDYQTWEDSQRANAERERLLNDPSDCPMSSMDFEIGNLMGATIDPTAQAAGPMGDAAVAGARRFARFVMIAALTLFLFTALGWLIGRVAHVPQWWGFALGVVSGPFVAAAVARRELGKSGQIARLQSETAESGNTSGPEMWVQYPHARREMLRELVFLTPCLVLAWVCGWFLSKNAGAVPPFWLVVFAGTLMGYLIGGGLVWLIRIGGSLAIGKEAMGLGDVHLMAAVGACVGWMDAAVAFPIAAFVGLYWHVVGRVATGESARAMPFGPYLAMATAAVVLAKPLVEMGLSWVMRVPVNMP